jgi:hypothetical protein
VKLRKLDPELARHFDETRHERRRRVRD